MSQLFSGIEPFVAVAETGSFRAAAAHLEVSPAAVSKAIKRLEDDLGVTLLDRTTRRVSLSREGSLFLPRAQEALAQLRAGRDLVELARRAPKGALTISLPYIMGQTVARVLPTFCARYPGLRLRLRFTDRLTRLIEDKVDIAVRLGRLADSSLLARKLLDTRWTTFASPSYLAAAPPLHSPGDLADHRCIGFRGPRGRLTPWTFADGDTAFTVQPEFAVELDQGDVLVAAAVAGTGIVQGPDFLVRDLIRQGRLVPVLPDHAAQGPPVHALTLPGQRRSPRIRAGIELLTQAFRPLQPSP